MTADAARGGLDDETGKGGGDAGVDRVAALAQNLGADVGVGLVAAGDGPSVREDGRAGGAG